MTRPAPTATRTASLVFAPTATSGNAGIIGTDRSLRERDAAHAQERGDRDRRGEADEWHEARKHPTPAEGMGDEAGQCRPGERGNDPGRREDLRTCARGGRGVTASDRAYTTDGTTPAPSPAPAGQNEQRHRGCQAPNDEADRRQRTARGERGRSRAPDVGLAARDDGAHESGQQVRTEHPPVQPGSPRSRLGR